MKQKKRYRFVWMAAAAALLVFAAVKWLDVEKLKSGYEEILQFAGRFSLTSSWRLAGARSFDGDSYTGEYEASCTNKNGTETLFGGISTKEHPVHLKAHLQTDQGNAFVVLETSGKTKTIPAVGGKVDECVVLSGQSKVQIKYEAFSGNVTLKLEKIEP